MRFLWKAGAWRLRTGCLGDCAPGSPRPAPPSHTPADGHAHLHHGGAVPLQGGQAAVQVGSPQVEEADHQGQGQLRLLPLGRHGALLGWGRGGGHHSSPCPGPGPLWAWGGRGLRGGVPERKEGGLAGSASLPHDASTPGFKFKPHRKGAGRAAGVAKHEGKQKKKKPGESVRQMQGRQRAGPPRPCRGRGHSPLPGWLPGHWGRWGPILPRRECEPPGRAPGPSPRPGARRRRRQPRCSRT